MPHLYQGNKKGAIFSNNKKEPKQIPVEPVEPTPPNGDIVKIDKMNVEITPRNITFGMESKKVAVDSEVTQDIIVKNKHRQTMIVLLERMNDAKTDMKYELTFDHPVSFSLEGGDEEK